MPSESPPLQKEESAEEPKPKRVFVEVGTNSLPVTYIGSREFAEDEVYVGIDKNLENVRRAKEITELERTQQNFHFVQADAAQLPLKNESAGEVFLGNVLGDPSISPIAKERFLEEAKRVLQRAGALVVKETNTPADRSFVEGLLTRHGFAVERVIDKESGEWRQNVDPYQKAFYDSTLGAEDSYLMYAKIEPQ